MEWQYIKDKFYFVDGSFRDIYVENVSRYHWEKWMSFVNTHYKVEFVYFDQDQVEHKSSEIISSRVLDYWNGVNDLTLNATVFIGKVLVKCYFFDDGEIENDIDPNEITSIEDHLNLLKYLKSISTELCKRVLMTLENYSYDEREILIIVDREQIII